MPNALAYLASYLIEKKHEVNVIDAFGEEPKKARLKDGFFFQGIEPREVYNLIDKDTELICFYAGMIWNHEANVELIRYLRKKFPKKKFVVLENVNQVTAYSLAKVKDVFFKLGIDYIFTGDLENSFDNFINNKKKGVISKNDKSVNRNDEFIIDLDKLPMPAWDFFPIHNYWNLGYSHAPLSSKRYLSILTSRGCPFNCNFCVCPDTSNNRWRFRSAKDVVDEIEYYHKKMGVKEFHFIDLNPSVKKERMKQIADEINKRDLKIYWKLGQGTKVETLNKETIKAMAKSGCNYISFSPESGSKDVLKNMNKYFDHDYALEMLREMQKNKITTQSCFILGYPGETKEDLKKTEEYIQKITKLGGDEVALFIMTPIPGSAVFSKYYKGYKRLDQLTFSPKWRKEYKELSRVRFRLYMKFFFWQMIYHPGKFFGKGFSFITGRFKTKIEMTIFRTLKVYWYFIKTRLFG